DSGALTQNGLSADQVHPWRMDVLTRARPMLEAGPAVYFFDVFDHDDRVGALGQRPTSHDADGNARTHSGRRQVPGGDFLHDFEVVGVVAGAHGVAINRRAWQGR